MIVSSQLHRPVPGISCSGAAVPEATRRSSIAIRSPMVFETASPVVPKGERIVRAAVQAICGMLEVKALCDGMVVLVGCEQRRYDPSQAFSHGNFFNNHALGLRCS